MRSWPKWMVLLHMQFLSVNVIAMDYQSVNSRESRNVEDRRADQYNELLKKCESAVSGAKSENLSFVSANYSVDVDTTGGYTFIAASARSGLSSTRSKLAIHYERADRSAQNAYETCANVAADLGESSSYDPLAKQLENKAISGMAEMINTRLRTKEKFESASREVEDFGRGIANIQDHTK